MGICNSSNTKKDIKNNTNLSQGIDSISVMRQNFEKEIKLNPFFPINVSSEQQNFVFQYESSNMLPSNFIQSNSKYCLSFHKQFSTVYLKSDPFLNNIFSDEKPKLSHLFFFNLSLFLLSNGGALDRKALFLETILIESFDSIHGKSNIGKLKEIFNSLINIVIFITIYFSAGLIIMDSNSRNKIFTEEFFSINGLYDICSLDDFFFHNFLKKDLTKEFIISIWENFLMSPINDILPPEPGDKLKERNYDGVFININDLVKEDIRTRLCHMLECSNFFESFLNKKIPDFDKLKYQFISK